MRTKLSAIILIAGFIFATGCATGSGGAGPADQRGFAQYTSLYAALRSVSGISVTGSESSPVISLRGGGSGSTANIQPLFVVNNQIMGNNYSQVNAAVLPANIKEIRILNGLSATNRYGQEGRAGVILITLIN